MDHVDASETDCPLSHSVMWEVPVAKPGTFYRRD